MKRLQIIKVGGNIVADSAVCQRLLAHFSDIQNPKILVHGGGRTASEIAEAMGIKSRLAAGRRITDAEMLRVVTMVYGGFINKNLVSRLQAGGCNAIGLTGADADIITARKRASAPIDYGFVGDISRVNTHMLKIFLEAGLIPVCAPLTHDGEGNLLNTNADTVAAELTGALTAHYDTELLYCFEKKGILTDLHQPDSVLPRLSFSEYQALKQNGVISRGMLPKLDNAFRALRKGARRVVVCHADDLPAAASRSRHVGSELYWK